MTDSSTYQNLAQYFGAIYRLGDSIKIFGNISLNNFIIALAILGIILTALLNFVRIGASHTVSSVKHQKESKSDE